MIESKIEKFFNEKMTSKLTKQSTGATVKFHNQLTKPEELYIKDKTKWSLSG